VSDLPATLQASIFIVIHSSPEYPSVLPELLGKRGQLPARHPVHRDAIEQGHIYVAPPDNQMLLRPGEVQVVRGPRENGHRPSVDALFRTASGAYGPRVIGVILSGYRDCGTAGMLSVKARGGIAVAQDPTTAMAKEMPQNVLDKVSVDYVVHPLELSGLLVRLVDTEAPQPEPVDTALQQLEGRALGEPAELVCPACQGTLTAARVGEYLNFRCHVGHAFSLESLVREQSDGLERALWAAVRALEESVTLSRRLSATATGELKGRFAEAVTTQLQHAEAIRQILLHGRLLSKNDAPGSSTEN
jgi:two-component system chemotaxis response regulator CheB